MNIKKKLLLTTALIGTLSVLGTANAELKIGAHMKLAYKSVEGFTSGAKNATGFTRETQIDLSSTGTLNNGMNYRAGFSLEQDGGETGFDGSEGLYVGVSSGDTYVQIGTDSAPLHGDYYIVPRAGSPMNEEIAAGGFNTYLAYSQDLQNIKGYSHIALQQTFGGNKVAITYVPNQSDKMGSNSASTGFGDTTVPNFAGHPAYSVGAEINSIPNTKVYAEYTKLSGDVTSTTQDATTKGIGFAYSMGPAKIGYEYQNAELTTKAETKTQEVGFVYKLSDNATAGIGRTVTEGKTTAGAAQPAKEKINYLQVGYNLGAIGTQISYIDANNLGYTAAQDSTAWVLKVNTKF